MRLTESRFSQYWQYNFKTQGLCGTKNSIIPYSAGNSLWERSGQKLFREEGQWEGLCGTKNSIIPYSAGNSLWEQGGQKLFQEEWHWEGLCGTKKTA